jgi:hypothetical protein
MTTASTTENSLITQL